MPMYYQYFGLSGPPFALSNTPVTLFLSSGHREAMAALQWGLREPSGFTMLVGDIGTGKTTLVQALLANRSQGVHSAFITSPTLSFEEILRVIAGQLNLTPERIGKLELIQALNAFVAALVPNESVALIFDEAQDLSDDTLEELRLLSNSQWPVAQRLQIVLVGQLELARRLERPELRQLNQRIGARALLPTLRPGEVSEYVEYRLRAHGGDVRKVFKRGALRELARLSGGIPRRINMLCHNALVLAYAQQARLVTAVHIEEAAHDYDHLLADSPSSSPAPQPRRRGALVEAGMALSLGVAALGLLYLTAPRALTGGASLHSPVTAPSLAVHDQGPKAAPITQRSSAEGRGIEADLTAVAPAADATGGPKGTAHRPLSAQPLPPAPEQQAEIAKTAPGAVADAALSSAPAVSATAVTMPQTLPSQVTVVVRKGDTLSKIALRHYGDAPPDDMRRKLAALVTANPEITDANHIYPGQIIRLQEVSKNNFGKVSK